jgi:hypothetical protein
MRQLNLALKFFLVLTALVAIGIWSATLADGGVSVLLAIALPATAAVLWGLLAAPKARWRLPLRLRAPFELSVFALGALALWGATSATAAVVVASLVVANAVLLTSFDQWEA